MGAGLLRERAGVERTVGKQIGDAKLGRDVDGPADPVSRRQRGQGWRRRGDTPVCRLIPLEAFDRAHSPSSSTTVRRRLLSVSRLCDNPSLFEEVVYPG